jgi:three-Cys-motif partner protein
MPAERPNADQVPEALPKGLDPEHYEIDETDGLPRQIVGEWVVHKHTLLRRYVDISGVGVRKKWLARGRAGATFTDLLAGPGRVRIRETNQVLDGSALVAWRQSVESKSPFTLMFVADAHPALCDAATIRLRAAGAPVHAEVGLAVETVDRVVPRLDPFALHFAFLDPFNLAALPFEVIRKLSTLKRMDILIHVSAQDINRNLRRYIKNLRSPLDAFSPGWRDHVDVGRPDFYVRARIVEHWRGLLGSAGMDTAEAAELVSGTNNQPLYWLAFAARHQRALEFWEKIRALEPNPQVGLL